MRTSALLLLAATAATAQPDTKPLSPTTVKLANLNATLVEVVARLPKSAGVTVIVDPRAMKAKCPAAFDGTLFWDALEEVARGTNTKLVVSDAGRTITLEPRGASQEVSAVSGPFRVVAKQVAARLILDYAESFHEVRLDVHWEPRMPVYRIDTKPRITKAADDRGTPLTADPPAALAHPAGAHTDMTVRLSGLTRDSKRIGVLAGELRATAAEKLLAFRFDDLAATKAVEQTLDGVTARLHPVEKLDDNSYAVELELQYPKSHPVFESFEEQKWLRDNRLRLVSPDASKSFESDAENADAAGPLVKASYRFKTDTKKGLVNPTGKGWSLVYEAPGPLTEFKVPFELREIPIP